MGTYVAETDAMIQTKVALIAALRGAGQSWEKIEGEVHWHHTKCKAMYAAWQAGAKKNKKEAPEQQPNTLAVEPQKATPPQEVILGEHKLEDDLCRLTASYIVDNAYQEYVALAENHIEIDEETPTLYQRRSMVLSMSQAMRLREFLNAHFPKKDAVRFNG